MASTRIATTQFRWVRALVVGTIWLFVLLISSPFMLYAMPDIEATIFPVLTEQEITETRLSDDGCKMLWRWNFTKNRRGIPMFASFQAYSRDKPRERTPVNVYVDWRCETTFMTSNTSSKGRDVTKFMCAPLPKNLCGRRDVVISGLFEYDVGNPFYVVPQRIPEHESDWPEMAAN